MAKCQGCEYDTDALVGVGVCGDCWAESGGSAGIYAVRGRRVKGER